MKQHLAEVSGTAGSCILTHAHLSQAMYGFVRNWGTPKNSWWGIINVSHPPNMLKTC